MANSIPAKPVIENTRKYKINNVVEALAIIANILDANENIGLSQLSSCTHFTKNKTFRLLSTLEQCGIVEKDQQNNFKIGITTIGIARKIMAKSSVLDNVRFYMEGLAKIVNEAVYFAYYKDCEAVLVDYVDGCLPIRVASFVGKAIQLPSSTKLVLSGKCLAMFGDITVNVGELDLDITTVSIPFVDDNGVEIGALVILAPTFRVPMDRIKTEIIPALREFMQRQSLKLPELNNNKMMSVTHPAEQAFGKRKAFITESSQIPGKTMRVVRSR